MIVSDRFKKRNKHGCVYCGSLRELTIDHKHPKILGGINKETNLQWLCMRCNTMKSAIPHKVLKNIFYWYETSIRNKVRFGKNIIKKIARNETYKL